MNMILLKLFTVFSVGYYKSLKHVNHTGYNIHDVLHDKLPFIKYQRIIDVFPAIPFFYLIYILCITKKYHLIKHYLLLFLMLFIIRLVLHSVTILPVIKSKKKDKKYMKRYCSKSIALTGGCNDYIFSGHMTITLLSVLFIMLVKQKVDVSLIIYSLVAAIMIICTHAHYTVDVILSIVITLLMFSSYFLCTDNDKCSNYFEIN